MRPAVTALVSCAGLYATTEGLARWPRRTPSHPWERLHSVELYALRRPDRYLVRLTFAEGVVLSTVRSTRWAHDRTARLAELLRLACTHAPATARLPAEVQEVARWGPRDRGRALATSAEAGGGADAWLDVARHHRATLNRKAARAAAEHALGLHPATEAAYKACAELLVWADASPVALAHAGQAWRHRYPDSHDASRFCLLHDLRTGEADAIPRAEAWLHSRPDDEEITLALAEAHVARGESEAASHVWERQIGLTENSPGQTAARCRASQARVRAEHHARLRGGRRARSLGFALSFIPGLLFFAFTAWQGVREAEREQKQLEQSLAEAQQQIEQAQVERERAVAEATGRAVGTAAEIEAHANAGDANAAYTMSEWLQQGAQGFEVDPRRALAYLDQAAEENHLQAMMKLAALLEKGDGILADPARAVALYERSAAQGSTRAASLAGFRYADGQGVDKDITKALPLLKQAVTGGDLPATTRLGWAYERGEGTEVDLPGALTLYRIAAEKNDTWAQERLVRLLNQPRTPHFDFNEAWDWTERGARNGSSTLQLTYARLLMSGRESTAKDRAQAAHWIREAHAKELPEGAYLWGRIHLIGWQVEQDLDVAAHAFQSAHGRRHPAAMLQLAKMHAFGLSVHRDPVEARALRDQFAASKPPESWLRDLDRLLAAAAEDLEGPPADGRRPGRVLWNEPPLYPGDLRRRRVTGFARVQYSLDEQGFTRDVTLLEASHPEFGPAAIAAVRQWRFDPEWENGVAQRGPTETTVRFNPPTGASAEP